MTESDKKEIEKLQERIRSLEDIRQANISILDTAVDGIIAISDKGVIEKFNKSAERLFGYLAEEVIGEKVNILMPEPMRGEHDSYLDNYKRSGTKKVIGIGREVIGQRKNGTTFPLHLSVGESLINNKRSFIAILRDISDLKESIDSLEESESKLRAIFDTAVDGFITINEKGIVQSFNRAAENLFGYKSDEVVGENIKILMPTPYQVEHDSYLKNYLSTNDKKIIGKGREVIGKRKDGTVFPIHLSVGETKLKTGKIFTGIVRDISEAKRSQEELMNKTKMLEEADWLKTQGAKFTKLSLSTNSLQELSQKTMSMLAKLIEIGQGAFYIIDKNSNEEISYKLWGTYAFVERKNNFNSIKPGENLVGQCILEGKPIVLTNVPDNYIKITSSLGEATPLSIYVMPLIFEDRVLGVIEMSAFHKINDLQMELVEQISVDLAIGINNIIKQIETDALLKRSESLAEELSSQQEELLQTNHMLKQQSSELETINEELEKNTIRLEEQKEEINNKNIELNRKQKEVEEKARALEKTNSYKSEFLANMSHEFRTPLNSLLILTDYLRENRESNLTEDQMKSLSIVQSSGQDLLSLVNDVLNLSKVEAGKLDVKFQEESIYSMIHEVEQMFIPMAKEQGLDFEVIKDNIPVSMVTDKNRLKQILKNLLQNAFKFTENGKITFKIYYKSEKKEIIFSITDTGIGIDKTEYENIFDSFTQIDSSLSKKYYGTGLGLTICNKLADLLQGAISVSSEVGKGSIFSLSLPIKPKIISSEVYAEDIVRKYPSKGKSILIAKDNNYEFIDVVSLIKDKFPEINIEVTDKQEELLNYIVDMKHDCILIDYALFGPDVCELLKSKRMQMGEELLIPFLIYTDKKLLHEEYTELMGLANGVIQKAKLAPSRLIKEIGTILNYKVSDKATKNIEHIDYSLKGRVLIVDDDVRSIYAMSKVLSDNGLTVEMAADGKKAIDKMEGDSIFDLVVMDIMMPGLNGYRTIEMIRGMLAYKEVPIIVATAKAMKGEEEKCIAAGASDYVSKPVNTKLLLEKIGYWINCDRDSQNI